MQEKCCAKSKYELIIKTSKSCDPNFSNSRRDTEAKTSPRHLNFLKPLNKTTEMCYPYTGIHVSGFKIHQGTEWVPCNTHITSRNLGIAYGPSFFFLSSSRGCHGKRKLLMDSHPYSHEISNFTLGAPHEKVQGMQTKLHPGFTMGKLVQPFPGISILRDSHIVLSKRS